MPNSPTGHRLVPARAGVGGRLEVGIVTEIEATQDPVCFPDAPLFILPPLFIFVQKTV